MKEPFLAKHQLDALEKMHNGCILWGGTGSGKSRTGLYYYFMKQGGAIEPEYKWMENPKDLYIITTAKKRDSIEWAEEMAPFCLHTDPEQNYYNNKVVVDSWNNIQKYTNIMNAFFILDEDKVTGSGAWVEAFYKIAKQNEWIILSATPGDTWTDYIPVFIANGFYRNKTEFNREHIVWKSYLKYPAVDRYLDTERLVRLRKKVLVPMDYSTPAVSHHDYIYTDFEIPLYKDVIRNRWDPYKDEPIAQASSLCYTLRRVCNSDISRLVALCELFEKHPRMIIFYNFDYELDMLRELYFGDNVEKAEWNSHKHQPVPESESWVYLVNYNAGAEAWNCITTDTIVFFSQTYSYKTLKQACGRIDRMNSPFADLYYYHLLSRSGIDLAIRRALENKKQFNEMKFVGNSLDDVKTRFKEVA